ncbi:alpha/beta fold hydrolase [Streptosporangium sp. CA-115845]|uniref:alpha/beta fold hydrolase n=1 Tax=Streptosporangium sp. CA-115845 TaxID=3240071 RepID=UPI003D94C6C5
MSPRRLTLTQGQPLNFDLRGHGLASAADRYSFEAFLSDLVAVMAEPGRLGPDSAPVLVGYSLGADLAVHYASEHPGTVAELVLIDGATPVPEPFITAAVLPEFRAMWEDLATQQEAEWGTARQVSLTAQEILDLNIDLDSSTSFSPWAGLLPGPPTAHGWSSWPTSWPPTSRRWPRRRARTMSTTSTSSHRASSRWTQAPRSHCSAAPTRSA